MYLFNNSSKFINLLISKQNQIETVFVLLILPSYYLDKYVNDFFSLVFLISISLLSIFYFFVARIVEEGDDTLLIFKKRISYWGYSLGLLGCLFHIKEYPGGNNMLIIGAGTVFISLILTFLISLKVIKSKKIKSEEIFRGILLFTVFLSVYLSI